MDRVSAMLILLVFLVSSVLLLLAFFAVAPVFCSCLVSLLYTLYIFISNERSKLHTAQEFENRFWTIFAVLFSTALFFARDSPIAFGRWSPGLGLAGVIICGYGMHIWDRHMHRLDLSRQVTLRRQSTATSSLVRLQALGIPVEEQLSRINSCLKDIDQLLIPSTINNMINLRFVMRKEREIISIFAECDARALNYLVGHTRLGLVFYKIKDHRNFSGQHRTELIQLLAVDRLPILTVISRVIVLHALQGLKLQANPRAEQWVRNILLCTRQDDLSDLKTLTDAKGMYLDMNKLIYDDIKSETVRQDILSHFRREAAVQQAHMQMKTKKSRIRKERQSWRKVLSDVDDTLFCSGGSYPAGVDKRYGKKVVYPGVLAFYRELDLGTSGPDEWPENRVGNLVFLSARPHVYKDVSEKHNFAKFEKLRLLEEGRKGLHTVPSILAGDIKSGRDYIVNNDMEPLARKKFDNFKRYVSIYPEYSHVFVCDNGQGDVRAGELMFDSFPYEFEALYVHVVKSIPDTHGYAPEEWDEKGLKPCFFSNYVEAAMDAATRNPPMIRIKGLHRVCQDAVKDFYLIQPKQWPTSRSKIDRRAELNQAIWRTNKIFEAKGIDAAPFIEAEQEWETGEFVSTPYGVGIIHSFDPILDMYEVRLDWRPLDIQVREHNAREKSNVKTRKSPLEKRVAPLETVVESEELETDVDLVSSNGAIPELIAETSEYDIIMPGEPSTPQKANFSTGTGRMDPPVQNAASPSETKKKEGDSDEKLTDKQQHDEIVNPGCLTPRPREAEDGTPESGGGSNDASGRFVFARIHTRNIQNYVPPALPKLLDRDRGSLFSFFSPSMRQAPEATFSVNANVTTPFGAGTVADYRKSDSIVVIKLIGWDATAYVHESCVKPASHGILRSLFRQLSGHETTAGRVVKSEALEFPYAKGSIIKTPFGEGTVSKPLPFKKDRTLSVDEATPTIGISLTSWVLADESHAMLYCPVSTATEWKETNGGDGKSSTHLFAAFGKIVSRGLRRLVDSDKKETQVASEAVLPQFEQYYESGAAVATLYGDGIVKRFRSNDGFYEIELINWKLANGIPLAILQKDDVSYRIAKGCHEGYPVLTTLGLSGTLASVEPTTGVHIVTVPSAGMVCYFQPESVVCPLKAAVGEDVLTAYGEGRVVRYRLSDDIYVISLVAYNATLYSRGETFDRVGDGMQDHQGPFGVSWLFRYLFYPSEQGSTNPPTRSRSNSISIRSQSGISAT